MLITLKSELKLIWIPRIKIDKGFYVTVFCAINNNTKLTITNIANKMSPLLF